MILDIQKISAPEVRVTRPPRPDRRGIDCYVSLRTGQDSRDRRPWSAHVLEVPANVRDHHVPRARHCGGV